jgi:hypothetical protein
MFKVDISRIEGFLHELDDPSQRKAIFLLRRLEEGLLPILPDPHGEKVEKDLYALRIASKSNPRLYYTVQHGQVTFITAVYKKSRKIPNQVLEHCRRAIADLAR